MSNHKIALITGASGGIGSATCRLLHKKGYIILVTDINIDSGLLLKKELGARAHFFSLDVSSPTEWNNLYQTILEQFGKIDVLFNNAGIIGLNENLGPQDPENISIEDWSKIHNVNLNGTFLGCKYGIKLMKQHGGCIINMSSRSGLIGVPDVCAYASSKAAIINHSKSVALYCANNNYNIRCNTIIGGRIKSPIWDHALKDSYHTEHDIAKIVPLKTMGSTEDAANLVVFLSSAKSKYITGTSISIDGGLGAGLTQII